MLSHAETWKDSSKKLITTGHILYAICVKFPEYANV